MHCTSGDVGTAAPSLSKLLGITQDRFDLDGALVAPDADLPEGLGLRVRKPHTDSIAPHASYSNHPSCKPTYNSTTVTSLSETATP